MMDEKAASQPTLEQITLAVQAALSPIKIYDVHKDQFRPITQQDVDAMQATIQAYGRLVTAFEGIRETQREEVRRILNKTDNK